MLDKNTMAQLSQLKQDIVSSKDLAEGTVVGSSGRYGFVKLTDGRTAFLNPEKMQRVFPGDQIKINVITNDKGQLEAEFEKLIGSPLQRFVGQYKIKGNAHFVVPTDKAINRWIFLPPQTRLKCKENDYVLAEVTRHPYQDSKAAAKIITHLGTDGDNYLHHNLLIAKYGLARYWSKEAQQQARDCAQLTQKHEAQDLTALPFVTIDAATTKDMDDALYVEAQDDGGWTLWAAIADPATFISPGSFVAKSARYFGQTVYLPGRVLPMLPEALATNVFSLQPSQQRPALVCRITITGDGEIQNHEFLHANICSQQKLSYQDVAAWLDGDTSALAECSDAIQTSLKSLAQLAEARLSWRQTHNIIFTDHADFDWQLNKQGFIESITRRERSSAHRLVEEAMIATNICAGEYLASHNSGIFNTQQGFRTERIGEVRALLREELGEDFEQQDIESFEGFVALIHKLKSDPAHQHLLAPLRRLMQTSELSTEQKPHMGMGFKAYAPITSPIRRYADICNHWFIRQLLQDKKPQPLPAKLIEQLSESIENARHAAREMDQILTSEYLSRHIGDEGTGVVRIVTQQGFGVRFVDTGMEGFVQIPKSVEKSFDAKRMTLSLGERTFALDQEVQVKVSAVDQEKRRVKLELVDLDVAALAATNKNDSNTESAAPR